MQCYAMIMVLKNILGGILAKLCRKASLFRPNTQLEDYNLIHLFIEHKSFPIVRHKFLIIKNKTDGYFYQGKLTL